MIRIALTQPDIRPYRLPVYNLLAKQEGIELTVLADTPGDAPPPADAMQFDYIHAPIAQIGSGRLHRFDQPGQIEATDPERFDLVIHSWNTRFRTLPQALRLARQRKLPTVLWGHGYSKRESRLRTWLRNRLGKKASAVMLYTHPVARRLVDQYGFDPARVFVAQNAIDQTPIQTARAEWLSKNGQLANFQRENGINPRQTVAFVSRLLDENRPDLLVDAVAKLAPRWPDLRVVIVGDGPERSKLESQAERLAVGPRVIFTGALYDEADLAPWLLSASMFCYPVNIGLSLMTALGFGLPAITADNIEAQNPEIAALKHGENGLLYPAGDQNGMITAINSLLSDNALRDHLAAGALRTVAEDFTLPRMVQGFLDATKLVDGTQRTVAS